MKTVAVKAENFYFVDLYLQSECVCRPKQRYILNAKSTNKQFEYKKGYRTSDNYFLSATATFFFSEIY